MLFASILGWDVISNTLSLTTTSKSSGKLVSILGCCNSVCFSRATRDSPAALGSDAYLKGFYFTIQIRIFLGPYTAKRSTKYWVCSPSETQRYLFVTVAVKPPSARILSASMLLKVSLNISTTRIK